MTQMQRVSHARTRRETRAPQTPPQSELRMVDSFILTLMILLLLFGLVVLFSATYYSAQDTGDPLSNVKKQLIGIALGTVACFILSRIDYHFFSKPSTVFALLSVSAVLLIMVLIPGIGVYINGSRRWLNIVGMSFQPSELAKFAVVIFLANVLTLRKAQVTSFFKGIIPFLIIPGFMFLLILEQPNLSTGGSIIIVSILMILCAGARWRHLGILGVLAAVVGGFYAWSAPYRRERLLSFRDPFAKMSDEGYQLSQSLIAFGSGGIFGQGLGQGRQKFAYLPYPESDFIFAIVGEDFGLVGCVAVVLLFALFVFAGMRVALRTEDRFGCLLASGITCMIGMQAFINMGVVTGILPTTGLPLPFFSAGGTSVSIIMAAVGILLNVSRQQRRI